MVRQFSLIERFHNQPGALIVVEGPDGCGKDKQVKLLAAALRKLHSRRRVIVTREPWDVPESPDGMRIKRILRHEETEIDPGDGNVDPAKFQRLYVSDRATHWKKLINPELEKGRIVICNRERMSTYVYGHAFGVDVNEIRFWHSFIPLPDVFIYLDTPAEVCAERIALRAIKEGTPIEFFEKKADLEKIVSSYRHIRDNGYLPVVAVDGVGKPREVHERVLLEALRVIESR